MMKLQGGKEIRITVRREEEKEITTEEEEITITREEKTTTEEEITIILKGHRTYSGM